jgi:hypothetical protein
VGRKEGAQGSRIGRKKRWPEEGAGPAVYIGKLNCNQWLKLNYRSVIHPTSESSIWIVKRSRFDDIFASAVSDRLSEQRFEKSNVWSSPEPLSIYFFFVLRLAHAARHSMWEDVAPKQRLHEAISPRTDPSIIHLIAREAQGLKRMPRSLQNRPEHRGSLQPTTMKWPPHVWTHWSCKSLHGCRNN